MHDSSLVGQCHVGTDKDVIGDGLTENFDTKNIGDYFFGFAFEIGVDKCDVVIGDYDISKSRETFFYSLFIMLAFYLREREKCQFGRLGNRKGEDEKQTCIFTESGKLFLKCCNS